MTYVMAVVYLCVSSGGCQTHSVMVETKACNAPVYHAKVAQNGEWAPATAGVKCTGRTAK